MDIFPDLERNNIPVVVVSGDSDQIVPYYENGKMLADAYKKADIDMEVYIKQWCDHHPHELETPEQVLRFLLK